MYTQFTSESVAAGHPDKICDQISDAIVDEALSIDPQSRVAVETLVTKDQVVLAGEVTCPTAIDYESIARHTIKRLGYTNELYHFDHHAPINIYIHQQSPDIAQGVDDGGAGDQGMMFGYAVDETADYMPLPITIAHMLVSAIDKARETKKIPYLRPDGKAEVVVEYKHGEPHSIPTVILAVPHNPKIAAKQVENDLRKHIVDPILNHYIPKTKISRVKLIVNGTGKWEIGGPASDTGVTGRKIIVDTYGGMGRHGGGAFSGKDPSKVDRSGAYACRYIAKNIVAAGLAKRCEVKVAYVIGQAQPISLDIETFNTAKKSSPVITDFAAKILNMSVANIIHHLHLRQPMYQSTAAYGHFGRPEFPWEEIVS